MKKHIKLLTIILCLLIIIISGTYAFFGARLNKTGSNTVSVRSKTLSLEFVDGPEIVLDKVLPGQILIKTFSVKNNGSDTETYNLGLIDVINDLSRRTDLVYTLTSTNNGASFSETTFPIIDNVFARDISIDANVTQEYTLTIEYKNLDADQSIDMNSHINATIQIIDQIFAYSYSRTAYGSESLTIPQSGVYKIEVWGAQGGRASSLVGGYGAYSVGEYALHQGETIYINVGGQGGSIANSSVGGGYNGGGSAKTSSTQDTAGSGGGATHVALQSGELSTLENAKEDIIIVAGGGGGAYYYYKFNSAGGHAGGSTGSVAPNGTCSEGRPLVIGQKASQENPGTGNTCGVSVGTASFGQGASGSNWYAGGGGGYYGGGAGGAHGANGGSGYLSPELTNAKMVCYGCTPDATPASLTEAKDCHNATATPECAKEGHGAFKITYLGT